MNQNNEQANQFPPQPNEPTIAMPQVPQNQVAGNPPTRQFEGLGQVAQGTPNDQAMPAGAIPLDSAGTWKLKYDKEHKRTRILTAVTAVACALALGTGVWGITKSSQPQAPERASGQFAGPGGMGGQGGPGARSDQGGPGQFLSNLFNSDGSVNTEQLEQFQSRAPQGMDLTQMIERAQESGAITEDQANKLIDALGSSSTTGSSFDSDSYDSNDNSDLETT